MHLLPWDDDAVASRRNGRTAGQARAADPLHQPRVFRPFFVRVLSVVVWALLGIFLLQSLRGGPDAVLRTAPALALVAVGAYALFWRPAVEVDDDGVTLLNVLRDVRVPFAALDAVDTRFALALHSGDRRFSAWAAPAPGRTSSMGLARREASGVEHLGVDVSEGLRASAAPNSDSGGAALLVQHRWERWRAETAGRAAATSDDIPHVRWNVPVAVLLLGCAVATAALLVQV